MSAVQYINSTVVTSPVSTVVFDQIPSTFTDLAVVMSGTTEETSTNDLKCRFNNDSSSIYSYTQFYASGTSVVSNHPSTQSSFRAGTSSNLYSSSILHVMSYSNTNMNKTALAQNGVGGVQTVRSSILWRSTQPITSLTFFTQNSKNFSIGFSFALWGVK